MFRCALVLAPHVLAGSVLACSATKAEPVGSPVAHAHTTACRDAPRALGRVAQAAEGKRCREVAARRMPESVEEARLEKRERLTRVVTAWLLSSGTTSASGTARPREWVYPGSWLA
jgi:hypothetical protein